ARRRLVSSATAYPSRAADFRKIRPEIEWPGAFLHYESLLHSSADSRYGRGSPLSGSNLKLAQRLRRRQQDERTQPAACAPDGARLNRARRNRSASSSFRLLRSSFIALVRNQLSRPVDGRSELADLIT